MYAALSHRVCIQDQIYYAWQTMPHRPTSPPDDSLHSPLLPTPPCVPPQVVQPCNARPAVHRTRRRAGLPQPSRAAAGAGPNLAARVVLTLAVQPGGLVAVQPRQRGGRRSAQLGPDRVCHAAQVAHQRARHDNAGGWVKAGRRS